MEQTNAALLPGRTSRQLLRETRDFLKQADALTQAPENLGGDAHLRARKIREQLAQQQLGAIPLERLRDTTGGRLRLDPLMKAGYRTLADVVDAQPYRLQTIPGIGPQTAGQVVAAARRIAEKIAEDVPVRLDPELRSDEQTELLRTLRRFGAAERAAAPHREDLSAVTPEMDRLASMAAPTGSRFKMFFLSSRRKTEGLQALAALSALMARPEIRNLASSVAEGLRSSLQKDLNGDGLWSDFLANASDYFTSLSVLGELDSDVHAAEGFAPEEIVAKVNQQQLDLKALRVSLRGYQAFGAKFALVQQRTIIGDEMGLGKTIEALASIGHLSSLGKTHFLVVCPASVLVNWIQEIDRRTSLRSWRVHGSERDRNLGRWGARGGIAVTTYDSLRTLVLPGQLQIDMLVADEAHYVKNPGARRSQALVLWMEVAERVVFLTGTPMENKPEEFRNLVRYLQPAVAKGLNGIDHVAGAVAFRKAVAPAYLRRNQADVLTELPELLEAEDWVQLTGRDLDEYKAAVEGGNFADLRRAAYRAGAAEHSSKLARLMDIVDESAANGWKVVVFSYFLEVLEIVKQSIGSAALHPLTGSVRPTERQELVDRFTAIDGHAVLVSQIQAGGVGLNLQAASVVILTEPQWKPSVEKQAVGRAFRMGQVRRVHVHRLLAMDSVDQHMVEILQRKGALFDAFVRDSALKDASLDAVDVSEMDIVGEVVSETAAERAILQAERRRLNLDPDPGGG